jgi:hypothetical protein
MVKHTIREFTTNFPLPHLALGLLSRVDPEVGMVGRSPGPYLLRRMTNPYLLPCWLKSLFIRFLGAIGSAQA